MNYTKLKNNDKVTEKYRNLSYILTYYCVLNKTSPVLSFSNCFYLLSSYLLFPLLSFLLLFFLFEGKALISSWGERDGDHWRKLITICFLIKFKLRDKRLMVRPRFMLQGFDLTADFRRFFFSKQRYLLSNKEG